MNPNVSSPPPPPENAALELDPIKLQAWQQQLLDEQSLPRGLVAGGLAAGLGAILWALVSVTADAQIGWMAIGVGLGVGFAMRFFGKGVDRTYGIVAAVLALLSCVAGNVLTSAIIISRVEQVSIFETLFLFIMSPTLIPSVLMATFNPIDLLFYGLAAYEGYRFSFRQITQAEKASLYRPRSSL